MVRIVYFFLWTNLWSRNFSLSLASYLSMSGSWQCTWGWFLSGIYTENFCSSTWGVTCFVKQASPSCNLIYFVLRRCLTAWVVISCLSHILKPSAPLRQDQVFTWLLRFCSRELVGPSIYCRLGWCDANTATMAPTSLFSLGWAVWGK